MDDLTLCTGKHPIRQKAVLAVGLGWLAVAAHMESRAKPIRLPVYYLCKHNMDYLLYKLLADGDPRLIDAHVASEQQEGEVYRCDRVFQGYKNEWLAQIEWYARLPGPRKQHIRMRACLQPLGGVMRYMQGEHRRGEGGHYGADAHSQDSTQSHEQPD